MKTRRGWEVVKISVETKANYHIYSVLMSSIIGSIFIYLFLVKNNFY